MLSQLTAAGLDPTNLPALDALPKSALMPVMKTFASSLGAQCSDCHASDFSVDTAKKEIAKKMWSTFVQQLNLANGQPLYCDSCHAGKMTFLDRSDESTLSAYMEANFVDGVSRKDGTAQSCTNCHGSPFDPNFLDDWGDVGDGGVTPDAGDAGVGTDGGVADLGVVPVPDLSSSTCVLSLNEVQVGGSAGAGDEFIEIYNPCATTLSLSGDTLVYRSATGTSNEVLLHFGTQTVPNHGYLVLGGKEYSGTAALSYSGSLAATGGGIALLDSSGGTLDTIAWGVASNAFVQGKPVAAPPSAQSAARIPDGSHAHGDQSLDLVVGTPTPGAAN
jgi:Lamin Tail Domain/Cytochrome c7 and related cytochrome c